MQEETEFSTRTGLQKQLPSYIRTTQLKRIAKERGDRIRTIRELVKKTLEEFASELGMNAGNLGRLERGDVCLSVFLADWMSRSLVNSGVVVTSQWLLSGKGALPQIIINDEMSIKEYLINKFNHSIPNSVEEQQKSELLMNHVSIFMYKQIYKDSIVTYVRDCKMEPVFFKGEIVAGYKVDVNHMNELDGSDCIIEPKLGGQIMIRRVYVRNNKLVLIDHKEHDPLILDSYPDAVAKINFRIGVPNHDIKINVFEGSEEGTIFNILDE
jgi:transcriptional regulator with XRE-family HTH domain